MVNQELLTPGCAIAAYTPQQLPQYKGNPLIEALPPRLSVDEMRELLSIRPDFDPEQRAWPTTLRLQMLSTLEHFLVPMARHVELVQSVDTMLRAGYVGRIPRTPAFARRVQAIYDAQKKGAPFKPTSGDLTTQSSALLMGVSGMGKTTVVRRWMHQYPEVIYHPEQNFYQVTRLHIEMPSDGSSVKGLAHAILHKMDELIPNVTYFEDYAGKGKTGADALMRGVASVLNMHAVGLLVADEVQNLANSHKGAQTVMTELVSACNTLGLPILFIGTNKAKKVFSLDFRQSRRASGHSIQHWDRLSHEPGSSHSEWLDFLDVLWAFQWVKEPGPLDAQFVELMYHYSAGVIDTAIKLFVSAQARAMWDGTERITPEVLKSVYNSEFGLMHPMIDALREDDYERLAQYEDIAPIRLQDLLDSVERRMNASASVAFKVKRGDPTFGHRVTASLIATGLEVEDAAAMAEEVEREGKALTVAAATQSALSKLQKPKPARRSKPSTSKDESPASPPNYEDRPDDYRRAIQLAQKDGSTVYAALQTLGMAKPADELIPLD